METNKFLIAFLFLPCCLASHPSEINAQVEKCEVVLASAPELRGFQLGMGVRDVDRILKHKPTTISGDIPGRKVLYLQRPSLMDLTRGMKVDESLKSMPGVDKLSLEFLDDKVISIYVHYNDLPFSDHLEFLSSVSSSMHLPRGAWLLKREQLTKYTYEMNCSGFTVGLFHSSAFDASISMNDSLAESEKQRRVEEQEKQKQRVFKP